MTRLSSAARKQLKTGEAGRFEARLIERGAHNVTPMPMLDVIFERVADTIGTSLSQSGRVPVDTSLTLVRQTILTQALDGAPRPMALGRAVARPWDGPVYVLLGGAVLSGLVSTLMGGPPTAAPAERPDLTRLELALARTLLEAILTRLTEGFGRTLSVSFDIDAVSGDGRIPGNDQIDLPCTAARYDLSIADLDGAIEILVPHTTLAPVRDQLSRVHHTQSLPGGRNWKSPITTGVRHSGARLTALLAEIPVTLDAALSWKPGDTLCLPPGATDGVTLLCEGTPALRGPMGRLKGDRIAVRTERVLPGHEALSDALRPSRSTDTTKETSEP